MTIPLLEQSVLKLSSSTNQKVKHQCSLADGCGITLQIGTDSFSTCLFPLGQWSHSHRGYVYVTVCRKLSFPLESAVLTLNRCGLWWLPLENGIAPAFPSKRPGLRIREMGSSGIESSGTEPRSWVRAFIAQMVFSWTLLKSWVISGRRFVPAWSLGSGVCGSSKKAQKVFWRTSVTCLCEGTDIFPH